MRARVLVLIAIFAGASIMGASFVVSGDVMGRGAVTEAERDVSGIAGTLVSKPHGVEVTYETALRARRAIKAGDYATARKIASDVLARSRLQRWRFSPFEDFVDAVSDAGDADLEAHLNAWLGQGGGAIPLVLRAKYLYDTGWLARGGKFAADVPKSSMTAFVDDMKRGVADVDAAIAADQSNPYPYYLKIRILRGYAGPAPVAQAFMEGIARHPGYYRLYDSMLNALEPRWYGSIPAMYSFVDRYAGKASQDSPLKMLYLSLYHRIAIAASNACERQANAEKEACFDRYMQKAATPQLQANVLTALQLYDHSDKYEFGAAIDFTLRDLLRRKEAGAYSGTILEFAAQIMHSDTRLKETGASPNNYLIDKAVAESWTTKGFYDNAITKYAEALKDIEAAQFPDAEEKYLAIADIYAVLPAIYEKLHKYPEMIAYDAAAMALGGKGNSLPYACFGYHRLGSHAAAIRACSANIDRESGNIEAHYWRGVAHRALGEADAALRDLTFVAEAAKGFAGRAVIETSMIHFRRNDNRGALAVLNRYSYLYDPARTAKESVAVGYNNRCYAYMELRELERALADCNQSLKYGSIPDAIRKKLELLKRLGRPNA